MSEKQEAIIREQTIVLLARNHENKQIINMCNERIEALGVILNKTDLKEIELNNL